MRERVGGGKRKNKTIYIKKEKLKKKRVKRKERKRK